MTVIDLTHLQTNPPANPKKVKLNERGTVATRKPTAVTGIVIHQTAAWYDVTAAQVRAAGGNSKHARNLRGLNIACHVIAWADGTACHVSPLRWYVNHANGFNARTLGLEIEGIYRGVDELPLKNGAQAFGADALRAAKAGLAYLVREGRAAGMPIRYVYAHRQSSGTRRADPGEEIWRKLVLEYAVPKLGLITRPALVEPPTSRTAAPGRPVPADWDPAGIGAY